MKLVKPGIRNPARFALLKGGMSLLSPEEKYQIKYCIIYSL